MIKFLERYNSQHPQVIAHFQNILGIVRPSGQEDEMRGYIIAYAEKNGFEYRIDERGNIAVDVPATDDLEGHSRVLLQAHMDMVCYGGNDTQPTEAFVDTDGYMKTQGTTLGADNGMGLAMILAVAEEANLAHGPLTLLFTVQEEIGLVGALRIGNNLVPDDTKMIFNLDAEGGSEHICVGCAGGCDIHASMRFTEKQNVTKEYSVLQIQLSGLKGGHSGIDIHKHHGNAIRLLANLLKQIQHTLEGEMMLIDFSGGTALNALPKEAQATIAAAPDHVAVIKKLIAEKKRQWREQGSLRDNLSAENAGKLAIKIHTVGDDIFSAISTGNLETLLDLCHELPLGAQKTLPENEEYVLLSNSMGMLEMLDESCEITLFPRAAQLDDMHVFMDTLCAVLRVAKLDVRIGREFVSWKEDIDAPAVQVAITAYKSLFEKEPLLFSYHAGLECAVIMNTLEQYGITDISAVSIGPRICNAHGPDEMVEMGSIDEVYGLLRVMVSAQ